MKPETGKWLELAEGDLGAAEALLRDGFYRQCIFECQQALEKLLKAIWVERTPEGHPPREHNLTLLARKADIALTKEQLAFLDDLSKQYLPVRYADVAIDSDVEYTREQAQNYYQRTSEQFQWLRQRLS